MNNLQNLRYMLKKCPRPQRGVTLVELTIVLIIIGILIYISINFSQQFGEISKRQEMPNQESAWKYVLDGLQKNYMLELGGAEVVLRSPAGVSLNLVAANIGNCGTAANINAIETILNNFAGDAEAQGLSSNPWGNRWCLRIGVNPTAVTVSGIPLNIRPLAVFSAGTQSGFQTAASDLDITCPRSAPGDSGHICSSGISAADKALQATTEKMAIIATKLQAYSRSQAILTPYGGFINYFLNAAVVVKANNCSIDPLNDPAYIFHSDSPLAPTTKTGSIDSRGMLITDIINDNYRFYNFEETLGITQSDAIDGFGNPMFLDNASCAVRHPYNPDTGESTPPFSIRIVARLPGGGELNRFVFSDF